MSKEIRGALSFATTAIQDMCVDNNHFDALIPQELLVVCQHNVDL
jgi:hypothetical protein